MKSHKICVIILTGRKRNVTISLQKINFFVTLDKKLDILGIHVIKIQLMNIIKNKEQSSLQISLLIYVIVCGVCVSGTYFTFFAINWNK